MHPLELLRAMGERAAERGEHIAGQPTPMAKAFNWKRLRLFSVTYDIVTEESAEHGDVEESGWIEKNVCLRDAMKALHATRTCHVGGVEGIEPDNRHNPQWVTVCNSSEYLTGANESRSIHFPKHITRSSARRIARLAGARL